VPQQQRAGSGGEACAQVRSSGAVRKGARAGA